MSGSSLAAGLERRQDGGMERPDAIGRIATIGPVLLLPLLVGGWSNVAIFLGIAMLAGIISGLISRDDGPEIKPDPRQPPPDP